MDDADRSPTAVGDSRNMKRKQVAVACFACQKRKSKCDGTRPKCQTCIKKGSDCVFDSDGDARRTENLKRKVTALGMENEALAKQSEELTQQNEALTQQSQGLTAQIEAGAQQNKALSTQSEDYGYIFRSLKGSSAEGALDIFNCMQMATTVEEVVRYCETRSSRPSTRDGEHDLATSSSEQCSNINVLKARIADFEGYLRNLRTSAPEQVIEKVRRLQEDSRTSSGIAAAPRSSSSHGKDKNPYHRSERYLDSDRQDNHVSHSPFSAKGPRSKQKSSMNFLLNPVVEAPKGSEYEPWTGVVDDPMMVQHLVDIYFTWYHPSCLVFSETLFRQDMIQGRNQYCSRVLVNAVLALACYLPGYSGGGRLKINTEMPVKFLSEAQKLLSEADEPSMMNIAALVIMAAVEMQRCRYGPAWLLSGRASQMAVHLGLHQCARRVGSPNETDRCLTFWAVFQLDQCTSALFERSPAILLHSVGIDVPPEDDRANDTVWPGTGFEGEFESRPNMQSRYMTFASKLAKIVNVTNDAFSAANYIYYPETVFAMYGQYEDWYAALQADLYLERASCPHVCILHMWYHSRVIHLFTPLLDYRGPITGLDYRQVCKNAALHISHMFFVYCNAFHMRGLHTQIGVALREACTIHVRLAPHYTKSKECLQIAVGTYEQYESRLPHAAAIVHEIKRLIEVNGVDIEPHLSLEDDEIFFNHPADRLNRPPPKLEWRDRSEVESMEIEPQPEKSNLDHFYKPKRP